MSDLIWGSRLSHSPRELGGEVAARVALKVVVEITGIVDLLRHDDACIRFEGGEDVVVQCGWFVCTVLAGNHAD